MDKVTRLHQRKLNIQSLTEFVDYTEANLISNECALTDVIIYSR